MSLQRMINWQKLGFLCELSQMNYIKALFHFATAARMFDMFDVGVMERLQWRLMCATQVQNGGTAISSAQTFTLRPQVIILLCVSFVVIVKPKYSQSC